MVFIADTEILRYWSLKGIAPETVGTGFQSATELWWMERAMSSSRTRAWVK